MFKTIEPGDNVDEMLKVINYNCKEAKNIEEQLASLEMAKNIQGDIQEQENISEIAECYYPTMEEDSEDEDKEKMDYICDYRRIEDANIENVLAILPDKDSYDYNEIIYALITESLLEIKEMTEIQMEDGVTDETKEFILNEREKMSILQNLLKKESLEEMGADNTDEDNKIILAPNKNGRIFVLDDVDSKVFPEEYYEELDKLIESIKDGTFKKRKRLTRGTNSCMKGVSEVRGSKVRVLFQRLGKNTYALFAAFLKKTNNDRGYQEFVITRIREFMKMRDFLKENLGNESFTELNDSNIKELYKKIRKEENGKVYKRGMK